MASDPIIPGTRFRLYRWATGAAVFMCLATTISLTRSNEYDDATMPDCDDPTALPERRSVKKSKGWSLNFSGTGVAKRFPDLRADMDSQDAVVYEIRLDPSDGQGAGNWKGAVHFDTMEIGKADNGKVNFTVQARGDGSLTWTDA